MLFILDRNEKIIGTLRHDLKVEDPSVSGGVFFDDLLTEDLATGSDIFEFTTYNTLKASQNLVIGNYIVFSFKGRYKLFQIIQIETSHDESLEMKIYCEGAGLELINKVIRKQKLVSCTLDRFLKTILADTGWEAGSTFLSEVSTDIEFESESVYSILQNNIGLFGGELDFRVEIKKNKIVAKYVDVYYEKGAVTGKRFEYGRNSDSITRNVDSSELFTALIGVGNNDINFSDVAIQGIEKPIGQDFVADQQAFERYNHNGYHLMGVFQYNTDSKEELLRETYKKLQECKEPKIQYEVSVCALEEEIGNVNIGDTVTVVDNFFNPPLWLMARVSKLETSKSNPQNSSCTLANFVEVSSNITDEMRKLASKLEGYVEGSISSKFPITGDNIADGSIGGNHVIRDSITTQHLKADSIEANHIKADQIEANHIKAETIETQHLKADIIESDHIKANQIEAKHIAANAISSDMIQAGSVTTDKMVISEGFIKDAMIDHINASKINAGTLNTNNISIGNDKILIADSTQQFRDNQGNVRLQLGEDAKGDFNFILKGKNGSTVLIDSEGIKEGAISDGLIKENMVGDGEIGGKKIDINSFVEEFNKETNTNSLKASKVSLDTLNQTLDVGFNQLKIKTDENLSTTNALQTSLKIEQGKIASLITNTTITKDGQTTQLKDEYNKTVQTVNSIQSNMGSLTTSIDEATKKVTAIDEKTNQFQKDLDSTKSTISSHTQKINELSSISSSTQTSIEQLNKSINLKAERTDIEIAISDLDIDGLREQIKDTGDSLTSLEETMNGTFKDGILDDSEKAILRQKLVDLDMEYNNLDARLSVLLGNKDLQESEQLIKLKSAKTANTNAYNRLARYIQNIIANKNGTEELDSLFSNYTSTFKKVEAEIQNSIDFIAEKKKSDSIGYTNKKMSEINVTPEAIISTVTSSPEYKKDIISGTKNLIIGGNFKLQTFEAWDNSRKRNVKFYTTTTGLVGITVIEWNYEGWIYSNHVNVKAMKSNKISFAVKMKVESNLRGAEVFLGHYGANKNLIREVWIGDASAGFEGEIVREGYIVPSDVHYVALRIDHNGLKKNTDYNVVLFLEYINLVEGDTVPHTFLQDDGITLKESYSKIEETAEGIKQTVSKKVGKNEIISSINQTAESVKISASKFEIDGTTLLNGQMKMLPTRGSTNYASLYAIKNGNGVNMRVQLGGAQQDGCFEIVSGSEAKYFWVNYQGAHSSNYHYFHTDSSNVGYNVDCLLENGCFRPMVDNKGYLGTQRHYWNQSWITNMYSRTLTTSSDVAIGGDINLSGSLIARYGNIHGNYIGSYGNIMANGTVKGNYLESIGSAKIASNLQVDNTATIKSTVYIGGSLEVKSYGTTLKELEVTSTTTLKGYTVIKNNSLGVEGFIYCNGNIEALQSGRGQINCNYLGSMGNIACRGTLSGSNLSISGSKNCVQETESYGKRLVNAYETADYLFGDVGESVVENGECVVWIDDIFKETISTDYEYQVFITKYGKGDIWVSERNADYFVVQAENDIRFAWEIKGKRKGYENYRLVEYKEESEIEQDE